MIQSFPLKLFFGNLFNNNPFLDIFGPNNCNTFPFSLPLTIELISDFAFLTYKKIEKIRYCLQNQHFESHGKIILRVILVENCKELSEFQSKIISDFCLIKEKGSIENCHYDIRISYVAYPIETISISKQNTFFYSHCFLRNEAGRRSNVLQHWTRFKRQWSSNSVQSFKKILPNWQTGQNNSAGVQQVIDPEQVPTEENVLQYR